ncbi:MAG: YraN family protein [Opitutaceae bacterium]|nr:YraN family protein [Opitutaceae bacterium]
MWERIRNWLRKQYQLSSSDIGSLGERAAEAFLRKKGYQVIVRNWRYKRDELDLICRDNEILVFVEVKTRSSRALVPGYYAIDRRKKTALLRGCRAYLRGLSVKPRAVRFDVVEVSRQSGKREKIYHFENVPLFPKEFARSS